MHHWAEVVIPMAKEWAPRGGRRRCPTGHALVVAVGQIMEKREHDIGWDWYVIGGRYSGRKAFLGLDQTKLEEFDQELKKTGLKSVEVVSALFSKRFPEWKGESPWKRDDYKDDGYPDDIMAAQDVPEGVRPYMIILPGEVIKSVKYDSETWKAIPQEIGDLREELAKRGIENACVVTVDYHS